MLNVVFTGPAVDNTGKSIVRIDLIEACAQRGINVQNSIRADTHLLVASRLDTVKARNAELRGIKAATYADFIWTVFQNELPTTGAHPSKYTDLMTPTGKVLPLNLVDADQL